MIGMAVETAPGLDVIGIGAPGACALKAGPNREHCDSDGETNDYRECN